ncbi:hypothetical protein QBC47DRAFT_389306 [Echria macrotheca]|uniref:DUF4336 domain-containing protein n=1 Tax=Echria macrotheca TaxID=438768 RepID=A0AAJ0F955_9PEZI|nr:hypothetical protein QBC47DRAFT_389306 [Echria macrotheca]
MSLDPSTVVIRDITPDITTFSIPYSLGPIRAGGRATTVRLPSGNIAVFSPTPLTPATVEKLASLGNQVAYIIAPNFEHHLNISAWSTQFPTAVVIGVEGLPEKRDKNDATRGITFGRVFTAENKRTLSISPEFDDVFHYEYVEAAKNKELVFVHKPSGTLIAADILFNLPATEQYSLTETDPQRGIVGMAVAKAFNAAEGMSLTWQKRNLWYVVARKDRAGFGESMKRVLGWQFDRVIPCHGDTIETGGKKVLEELTSWFVEGKQGKLAATAELGGYIGEDCL